jgi:peptidoglycan/xylan/chitin deacetylase (PgdA/CDA1 family)
MRATLTYHSIDASGSPISVPQDAFDAHCRWLGSGRVRVLSLDDLLAHPDDGPDAVAVTFDDGFANIEAPVSALLDAGLPATIFVVTGHAGGTNAWGGRDQPGIPTLPLLGWDALAELAARGATIGAHTRRHPSLPGLTAAEIDDELLGCDDDLRSRLGVGAAHLAYPYGDADATVSGRAAARFRFGHTTAFRTLSHADDRFMLPRLDMYYFRGAGRLEAWGTPLFARRLSWIRFRRAMKGLQKADFGLSLRGRTEGGGVARGRN